MRGHSCDSHLYEPGQGAAVQPAHRLDAAGDVREAGAGAHRARAVPRAQRHDRLLEDDRLQTALAI